MSDEFHHKMVLKYGQQSYLPENWIYKKSRMKTKLKRAEEFNFPALARIITKLKYHIDNNLTIEAL